MVIEGNCAQCVCFLLNEKFFLKFNEKDSGTFTFIKFSRLIRAGTVSTLISKDGNVVMNVVHE